MKLHLVHDLESIQGFKNAWETIYRSNQRYTVQNGFDWNYSIYKHFGDAGINALIAVEDANEWCGFLPMLQHPIKVARWLPVNQMTFCGVPQGITDFGEMVLDQDWLKDDSGFLSLLLTQLCPFMQMVHLKYLCEQGPTWQKIDAIFGSMRNQAEMNQCSKIYYIDLEEIKDFEHYHAQLGYNLRKDIKKKLKKLDRSRWHFEVNGSPPIGEMVAIMQKLYNKRHLQMGHRDFFSGRSFIDFLNGLSSRLAEKQELLFSLLTIEEHPVSFALGFVKDAIYYHWMVSFDPDFAGLSPNKLHHYLLIQHCLENGFIEFNFMRGSSEYKQQLTSTFYLSHEIKIWNPYSWYSRSIGWAKQRRR